MPPARIGRDGLHVEQERALVPQLGAGQADPGHGPQAIVAFADRSEAQLWVARARAPARTPRRLSINTLIVPVAKERPFTLKLLKAFSMGRLAM